MTEEIKAASDEQVQALKDGIENRTWRNFEDVAAAMTVDILLARIDADRALLEEARNQVAALVMVIGGLRDQLGNVETASRALLAKLEKRS